ncbi:MAG: GerW family sporulation protein [Vicinamibacterales bacterium]
MEHVESLLKTTLAEIERLLTTRTVVGEPMHIGGNTVIPLVSVGFGFGAGGGSGKETKTTQGEGQGAGSGGGGGVRPVAVIIVNDAGVRVEPVRKGAATMVEKVGEAVSRIVESRGEKRQERETSQGTPTDPGA